MPLLRCPMYDDSGKAVNGGCRSQGLTCDYIHPNERGWTRAPFRNHHLPTPLGIPDSVRGQAPQQNPNTSKAERRRANRDRQRGYRTESERENFSNTSLNVRPWGSSANAGFPGRANINVSSTGGWKVMNLDDEEEGDKNKGKDKGKGRARDTSPRIDDSKSKQEGPWGTSNWGVKHDDWGEFLDRSEPDWTSGEPASATWKIDNLNQASSSWATSKSLKDKGMSPSRDGTGFGRKLSSPTSPLKPNVFPTERYVVSQKAWRTPNTEDYEWGANTENIGRSPSSASHRTPIEISQGDQFERSRLASETGILSSLSSMEIDSPGVSGSHREVSKEPKITHQTHFPSKNRPEKSSAVNVTTKKHSSSAIPVSNSAPQPRESLTDVSQPRAEDIWGTFIDLVYKAMRQKTDLDEASKVLENYRRSQRSSRYLKAGESAGHILDATREALGLVVSDLHCAFSDSLSAIVAFQELFDAPMKVLWDDKPRTALTQNDVEKVKSYVKDLGEWIIHAESVLGPIIQEAHGQRETLTRQANITTDNQATSSMFKRSPSSKPALFNMKKIEKELDVLEDKIKMIEETVTDTKDENKVNEYVEERIEEAMNTRRLKWTKGEHRNHKVTKTVTDYKKQSAYLTNKIERLALEAGEIIKKQEALDSQIKLMSDTQRSPPWRDFNELQVALINQRSVNVELRKILDEQTEKLKQLQALVRETQTSPAAVNNQGLTSVQQVLDGLHPKLEELQQEIILAAYSVLRHASSYLQRSVRGAGTGPTTSKSLE